MNSKSGAERRQADRREIIDQFSFYICIPKLGFTRHQVNDVSELGIGFTLDTLGEFKLKKDETCELQFYLNQSLFLKLDIKVMRQIDSAATQEVGATFLNQESPQYQTLLTIVRLIDQLAEAGSLIEQS